MAAPGARLFGRGIGFPPRLGADGRLAWSEGEENVLESVRIILLTEERERLRLPDFGGGLGRFLFEPNAASTHQRIRDRITRTLAAFEPRIRVESVEVAADPADPESAIASIAYRLLATGAEGRASLRVQLGGGA
jgi:phage baseplate assembly protein W